MWWIPISILIVAIDRFTKYIASVNIPEGTKQKIITGFFYLTYHENRGAAFGILQNARYFFIALTIITCLAMIIYILKSRIIFLKLSLAVILGGAVGNLIDRISTGGVPDFLDFYFWGWNFPTFNAADIFIVIGTILLSIYLLFIYKVKPLN